MKRFASKYLEILNELIDDRDEIVTYKKLSCIGKIPVNQAKEVLDEYASKREDLQVIYTLIGSVEQNHEKVTKIQFCKESLLKAVKENYSKITSCHVYSISKTKILGSAMLYSDEKIEQSNMKVYLEGVSKGVEKLETVISSEVGSKCENKPLKREAVAEKKKEVVKNEKEKNNKEKLITEKPQETKANLNETAKIEVKTEKRKGSSDFFKTTANPKKNVPSKKKDESKVQIEDDDSDDIIPNKTKRSSLQNTKTNIESKNRLQVQDKEESEKKQSKKEEKKKENSKKKSTGASDSSVSKRRKRIAIESSSEEEEESKPAESVEDSTQASITELTQPEGGAKRRKRVRKQVTKTFVNDEGYMVTEKVYESASTDASEDELKKPESKKPVETSKPKKRGRKVAENQSTLMSFFKKQ